VTRYEAWQLYRAYAGAPDVPAADPSFSKMSATSENVQTSGELPTEDERDEHAPRCGGVLQNMAMNGDGRMPAHSNGHDERLLAALRQRGRAPMWKLAWEAGLSDAEALAAAQRLLEAGMIRRVGDNLRAPLSVWSELALVKEAQP
jgi:hypothetical protein